jgi:protein tyrosine/serine phosphatase
VRSSFFSRPLRASFLARLRSLTGRRFFQVLAITLSPIGLVATGAGSWAVYLFVTGNIHEVEQGAVYRSGQLRSSRLATLLRERGIRTVVNLRGESPGEGWYEDERRVTEAAGARYISLPMSANEEPNEALLASLVKILDTAAQPMLIHCNAGADRSGLASALYQYFHMGRNAEEADEQLSLRYGHFPWLTSSTGAMDRTYWRVVNRASPKSALAR